jgi:hypothetical protein
MGPLHDYHRPKPRSTRIHDCNCWDLHVSLGRSSTNDITARFQEYQIIGRHLPTESNTAPKIYRMRIFAPNEVVAKSRFWYFLGKLRKIKKANGEIVSVNQVCSSSCAWLRSHNKQRGTRN